MINDRIDAFLLHSLPKLRLAVLGDVMVDRYIFGDVSRISPEAPVPVNLVSSIKEVLGGAANVANNLAHLDCQVALAGIAGIDDHGRLLEELLQDNRIDDSGILYELTHKTTTKMRILGNQQQMLRLDFEATESINKEEENRLLNWLKKQLEKGLDGIVISDYGKGVCTPSLLKQVFGLAKAHQVPTIVDPKGNDWTKYNGATCITPNIKELGQCLGRSLANKDDIVVEGAKEVLKKVAIDYIIATRSAKGISVISKDQQVWHNPATKQEVFDVSGAGDTVVAMMITTMAAGLSIRTALHVANTAAGIVVSKVGTYPIHRQELIDEWNEFRNRTRRHTGVLSWDDMARQIKQWQDKGETVVFTNGCFDILHPGHITYLAQAADLGDHLIVGLNSDASVRQLKGESRPINKQEDRVTMLMALSSIDGVVIFNENTPAKLLSVLRPDILVKGGDYRPETVIGGEFVDHVDILPFKEGYSTTGLIHRIKALVKEGKL